MGATREQAVELAATCCASLIESAQIYDLSGDRLEPSDLITGLQRDFLASHCKSDSVETSPLVRSFLLPGTPVQIAVSEVVKEIWPETGDENFAVRFSFVPPLLFPSTMRGSNKEELVSQLIRYVIGAVGAWVQSAKEGLERLDRENLRDDMLSILEGPGDLNGSEA